MSSSSSDDEGPANNKRIKSNYDLQRIQLQKLMENPNKEVIIPNLPGNKEETPRAFHTHEFVRNVMGASAGAGSGEFDIYRGCRRRELIRQEFLTTEADKERVAREFEEKRLQNLKEAEERTAKKRAKRQKQKSKLKNKKTTNKTDNKSDSESESEKEKEKETETLSEEVIDLDEKVETQKDTINEQTGIKV